jgi:4-aminobutyrate aminotransferase/4-aminobutyrate aminotransferase/(S)-3-amino-2-methylpropionate transaminase
MTMAKALGNGVPIGVFTAPPEIADTYTRPGASTLGGNPVSMVAGLATIEVIEKENLIANAASVGAYLKERLLELQEKHPIIGDVRGIGLMLGAELVREGKEPAAAATDAVLEKMKDRGIIIGKNGRYRNRAHRSGKNMLRSGGRKNARAGKRESADNDRPCL